MGQTEAWVWIVDIATVLVAIAAIVSVTFSAMTTRKRSRDMQSSVASAEASARAANKRALDIERVATDLHLEIEDLRTQVRRLMNDEPPSR